MRNEVIVTVAEHCTYIALIAYKKYYTPLGTMITPTSVAFDFMEDAEEFKQCLCEEFDANPDDIKIKNSYNEK
jgi:hypothetical protein